MGSCLRVLLAVLTVIAAPTDALARNKPRTVKLPKKLASLAKVICANQNNNFTGDWRALERVFPKSSAKGWSLLTTSVVKNRGHQVAVSRRYDDGNRYLDITIGDPLNPALRGPRLHNGVFAPKGATDTRVDLGCPPSPAAAFRFHPFGEPKEGVIGEAEFKFAAGDLTVKLGLDRTTSKHEILSLARLLDAKALSRVLKHRKR